MGDGASSHSRQGEGRHPPLTTSDQVTKSPTDRSPHCAIRPLLPATEASSLHQIPGVPLARPDGFPTGGVPVMTPPLDGLLTVARVAGGIDVDHPPAPSGLGEYPRSHCANDSELVDPAVERIHGHGGRVAGSSLPLRSDWSHGSVAVRLPSLF